MADDPLMEGYEPLIPTADGPRNPLDYPPRIKGLVPGKKELDISIAPSVALNFGSIAANLRSNPFQVLIINRGYREVFVDNIEIVGDFTAEIPRNRYIQPGETMILPVVFVPKRAGDHTGAIYVTAGNASGDRWLKLVGSSPVVAP